MNSQIKEIQSIPNYKKYLTILERVRKACKNKNQRTMVVNSFFSRLVHKKVLKDSDRTKLMNFYRGLER